MTSPAASSGTPSSSTAPSSFSELWRLTPARYAEHLTRRDRVPYLRPLHIDRLSDLLARRIARGGARIIVSIPPRHGKSEQTSVVLPNWALSNWPDWPVLFATYEARFATEWGGKAKRFALEHPEGGVRVVKNWMASDAAWRTPEGGGMWCSGAMGPMVGRGAKLLVVDDPIKNPLEAYSTVVQDRLWAWWQMTARPRLEPGGSAVMVLHRWHQHDLPGRLLAQAEAGGEPWEYFRLPAIAEENDPLGRAPGDPLWRERYDADALNAIRTSMTGPRWRVLYQQDDRAWTGSMMKREWFKLEDKAPPGVRWCRMWDFAGTTASTANEDPDYTAGALLGVKDGEWYLADVRRKRVVGAPLEAWLRATAAEDRALMAPAHVAIRAEVEPGGSAKQWIDHLARTVFVGYDFKGDHVTGSKERRAEPVAAAAEHGHFHVVKGPWVKEYLDEAEAFPDGPHDDQIDATSGAQTHLATGARLEWEKVRRPDSIEDDGWPRRRKDEDDRKRPPDARSYKPW